MIGLSIKSAIEEGAERVRHAARRRAIQVRLGAPGARARAVEAYPPSLRGGVPRAVALDRAARKTARRWLPRTRAAGITAEGQRCGD